MWESGQSWSEEFCACLPSQPISLMLAALPPGRLAWPVRPPGWKGNEPQRSEICTRQPLPLKTTTCIMRCTCSIPVREPRGYTYQGLCVQLYVCDVWKEVSGQGWDGRGLAPYSLGDKQHTPLLASCVFSAYIHSTGSLPLRGCHPLEW